MGPEPQDAAPPLIVLRVVIRSPDLDTFVAKYARFVKDDRIFIFTKSSQPPDTRVRFTLELADGQVLLVGEGTVTRVRPDTGDVTRPPGMELRFRPLDERSRKLVERMLAVRSAPAGEVETGAAAGAASSAAAGAGGGAATGASGAVASGGAAAVALANAMGGVAGVIAGVVAAASTGAAGGGVAVAADAARGDAAGAAGGGVAATAPGAASGAAGFAGGGGAGATHGGGAAGTGVTANARPPEAFAGTAVAGVPQRLDLTPRRRTRPPSEPVPILPPLEKTDAHASMGDAEARARVAAILSGARAEARSRPTTPPRLPPTGATGPARERSDGHATVNDRPSPLAAALREVADHGLPAADGAAELAPPTPLPSPLPPPATPLEGGDENAFAGLGPAPAFAEAFRGGLGQPEDGLVPANPFSEISEGAIEYFVEWSLEQSTAPRPRGGSASFDNVPMQPPQKEARRLGRRSLVALGLGVGLVVGMTAGALGLWLLGPRRAADLPVAPVAAAPAEPEHTPAVATAQPVADPAKPTADPMKPPTEPAKSSADPTKPSTEPSAPSPAGAASTPAVAHAASPADPATSPAAPPSDPSTAPAAPPAPVAAAPTPSSTHASATHPPAAPEVAARPAPARAADEEHEAARPPSKPAVVSAAPRLSAGEELPRPAAGPQSLAVVTHPDGASVTVDGAPAGVTPVTLPLSAGRHQVSVSKERYRTINTTGVAPGQLELTLKHIAATLRVTSDAAGAEVIVDGRARGRAPYEEALEAYHHYDVEVTAGGNRWRSRVILKPPLTELKAHLTPGRSPRPLVPAVSSQLPGRRARLPSDP